MGPSLTLGAFAASAVIGGLMALVMVAWSGQFIKHWVQFQVIGHEILTVRNPEKLSEIAAARKPSMMLLPYGIPIAVGSIAYFAWAGILS
jgi:prepilin peptidase CpaA